MTERTRIIAMTGGHNFRDIGGYKAIDGKVTIWGQVYRAGTMAELDDGDHAVLEALGLEVICDFRSTKERDRRPSRLPDSAKHKIRSQNYRTSGADLVRALARPDATPDLARDMMIQLYAEILIEQLPNYRELFEHLAAGRLPILFHCSAGKDRTGVAAALLLDFLGVSRDQVLEDYILTNRFVERGIELVRNDPWAERLRTIDDAIWAPVMDANPEYLKTMFDVVETRYGSSENYIRQELGLDDDALATIRARLLT